MPGQNALRTVVPVLGMHRSGTSLTTGLLSALGVSLSEDLMPPTDANAIGYFESLGIREIHDKVLAALGSAWDASTTLNPLPHEWWRLPQIAPLKSELKARVSEELARVQGVWGFKDPRTARLLPLWDEIFDELELEPRFVLVGRHPRDVAHSLQARDRFQPLYSELLWLEHTTDAITYGKDRVRAIVDYGRWFEEPLAQARYVVSSLGFDMPDDRMLQDVIDRYVSSDLRHHTTVGDDYQLPFSRDLYQAMVRRDRQELENLAELFRVTSAFSNRVVRFTVQNIIRT